MLSLVPGEPMTPSAVPFMRVAPCLLLLLFFPSPNNDGRNKRRPVDDKYSRARESPSLSARYLDRRSRTWRRLSDERDSPSGGDTVSPPSRFFFISPHLSGTVGGLIFSRRESYYRARRSAYQLLSARVTNDRRAIDCTLNESPIR